MSEIIQSQTQMSSRGSAALAIGTLLATGHAYWPAHELQPYVIDHTVSSYSEVTERIVALAKNPRPNFVDQMASIYSTFSQRQELLGQEFEAAIFDDLDSLYES